MMKVLQYFEVDNKEHWLGEIAKSNWDAAHYLHYLLKENKLDEIFDWYEKNKNGIILSDKTRKTLESILDELKKKLEEVNN